MSTPSENRFEDFFADEAYVALKNHLYNYRLRRHAVSKCLENEKIDRVLEVGSGLSPMLDGQGRIVYSELSFPALRLMKSRQGTGSYAVADAVRLPFKPGSFSQVICSEVIEHLPDDQAALHEMARVLSQEGSLILTFPHRRFYFALDDLFVGHFRRYELQDVETRLAEAGLGMVEVRNVFGPLEKLTMWSVVLIMTLLKHVRRDEARRRSRWETGKIARLCFQWFNHLYAIPVRLDALIVPRCLATVLLVRAMKLPGKRDLS